ncbi:hypothetical protein E6R60_05705 [Streptomyces sp. A0642]|uniref:hypothetical protein n=1 Tax=Streptomyces sp. A0642 TaxID=2563100 RepID=UPI0010A2989A|nr:hypothetical protein [Streptomyces sp. A0642]THA78380.1 hypothetical protein E6R60_05705 [Streptomyces sp. A0642]
MSETETPTERSMRMRLASHKSWAGTPDRSARTAAARKASHHTRFLKAARELHPDATDEQITAVAESLRSAHYTELALRSAKARRLKAATRDTSAAAA